MGQAFRRVAIVNRGQVALRFIQSVREFNREHGTDLRAVALYTDPEQGAAYVREADDAVSLGEATFLDPRSGRRRSRYVDHPAITAAMRAARCDAAWVGWGFSPDHLAFVELCERLDITFLGPPLAALRRLSDKIATKRLCGELGVPVVPWSERPVETLAEARAAAAALGYPLLVKAALGGAGRGLRRVDTAGELEAAFAEVRATAERLFDNPACFLERHVPAARLIAVQVLADAHGTVWDVGLRDGSVQRSFCKLLDEGPPAGLPPGLESRLRRAATTVLAAAGYQGAGSVEFLVDGAGQAALLEVNPRLETAHDLLEATTGLDLIKQQIRVARGGRLEGSPPPQLGHAFEVRIRAEDPQRGFEAAPGLVDAFRPPMGPGIRVESSLSDGDEVPPGFSTLLAKIVAQGTTRVEALARMERGLHDCLLVLCGGVSNRSFLLSVVAQGELKAGPVDVDWLDRLAQGGALLVAPHAEVALVAAAIEEHDAQVERDRAAFLASADRGRPSVRPEIGRTVELFHLGHRYPFRLARLGPEDYAVEVGGRRQAIAYRRQGRLERRLLVSGGLGYRVVAARDELGYSVDVEGSSHRVFGEQGGLVRSPAPGMVQSVAVSAGQVVERGAVLLKLEAMKMEMTLFAPFAGRVREVFAVANVPVPLGAPLVFLGALEAPAAAAPGGPAVAFDFPSPARVTAPVPAPRERWLESLRRLRMLMLGYDLDAARVKLLLADCEAQARTVGPADPAVFAMERAVVRTFVDVAALFRRRPGAGDEIEEASDGIGAEEHLITYLRTRDPRAGRLPPRFLSALTTALGHYGVRSLSPSPALEEALFWIFKHHERGGAVARAVAPLLERWLQAAEALAGQADAELAALLDGLVRATRRSDRGLNDLAQEVAYRLFARPAFERWERLTLAEAERDLAALSASPGSAARAAALSRLVASPCPLSLRFGERLPSASAEERRRMIEVLCARYYRHHGLGELALLPIAGQPLALAGDYQDADGPRRLLALHCDHAGVGEALARVAAALATATESATPLTLEVFAASATRLPADAELVAQVGALVSSAGLPAQVSRVSLSITCPADGGGGGTRAHHSSFVPGAAGGYLEERRLRGLHPMIAERLRLSTLSEFDLELLSAGRDVYVWKGVATGSPRDERLFAVVEVRDLTPVRDGQGRVTGLPHMERLFQEAVAALRLEQSRRPPDRRLHWNRIELQVWPVIDLSPEDIAHLIDKLEPAAENLGLEKVVVRGRLLDHKSGTVRARAFHLSKPTGMSLSFREAEATDEPVRPLSDYEQKVLRLRQRGLTYPLEIVRMLTPPRPEPGAPAAAFPPGDFVEYDLVGEALAPVRRAPGNNTANLICGVLRSYTARYPEGIARVVLLSDPSRNLGSLAEPECRRINAALALAAERKLPLEWFALSSGAKIAMDSGTENMDWIALTLRRLIEFTQGGGEINVVVMGINVGGQPYWNAESTMLMHTRGILIMMPQSAMVLTGKRALDYSGGQSAEDDLGIGGYDRIMGVNGQAQYFAGDIADACRILYAHYDHCYVHPGERFPRPAPTTDPAARDVTLSPHGDHFATVGEIFSDQHNPGRKKPFHIRKVMAAAIDQDHPPLERWHDMRDAEVAVVWDAHIGGYPVCLLGLESEPIARRGPVPADGPAQWTGGTLFPQASKKVARTVNAATGNRPLVILANLSGFDGSPESMRSCQLEYGAEIGRAVVNFRGPIVFCVVSRFHGGAYVVFSRTLNENIEVTALSGTYASVIGGAPAAGVVFAGEVEARAKADPRALALAERLAAASDADKRRLRGELDELLRLLRAEKVGQIAEEFDREHSVERALKVGSLHRIIPPSSMRPYLIDAIGRGMQRELERLAGARAG